MVPEIRDIDVLVAEEGHVRKSTGSYYTPRPLIETVLQSTVVSALERIREVPIDEQETAILNLTVCDPACGAGNFLLAAAQILADVLVQVRRARGVPRSDDKALAMLDVLMNCIFGVDIHNMSTEICRMTLLLHIEPHSCPPLKLNIHCGDALLWADQIL